MGGYYPLAAPDEDEQRRRELAQQGYPLGDQSDAPVFPVSPEYAAKADTPAIPAVPLSPRISATPSLSPSALTRRAISSRAPNDAVPALPALSTSGDDHELSSVLRTPTPQPRDGDGGPRPRLVRRSGEPVDASASSPIMTASGYAPVGGTDDLERHTSLASYRGPDAVPAVGTPSEERLKKLTTSGAPPVEPLHGWKKGLDIAGQLFAPTRGLEKSLRYGPQTRYAENLKQAEGDVAAEQAPEAAKAKTQELQSRGEFEQAHAEAVRHPQPKVKTPEEQSFDDYLAKGMSPTDAFKKVKEDAQSVKPEKPDNAEQQYVDEYQKTHLGASVAEAQKAFKKNEAVSEPGSYMPLYDKEGKVVGSWNAKTGEVRNAPNLPGTTSQGQGIADRDTAATRKEVTAHDKAYVQPAEGVEKSYQMMNSAFQEYEAARAQGKDLPTGAQSMLALSTHLSTTFGNVKGARVTKDMIHEHLGARSISDSALVAFQKLTNGDQLSPDQWKAFHDLISESRKLSWQQAAKEADRKHIPVDFLPKDLQGAAHEPGEKDAELKPPKAADPGMKWQHRTVNDKTEWRQVKQ